MTGRRVKVLLVGNYPPPYGGMSVQISVLQRLLADMPRFNCRVLDIGDLRRQTRPGCLNVNNGLDFAWKLAWHSARGYIIHLHTNGHNTKSWAVSLMCALVGVANRRRTILSIGSGLAPEFVEKASRPICALIKCALTLSAAVICRNARTKAVVMNLGIPPAKVALLSGFYGVSQDALPVPGKIQQFLDDHSPTVGAMASVGEEYGVDLLIESVRRLRTVWPRLGALLIGPGGRGQHALNGDLLVTGEVPHETALSAMQRLDVFVRPTYFDGDASSVREALALGVPVVASDTDFRPEGVIVFQKGQVHDLCQKILEVLARARATPPRTVPTEEPLRGLLALYDSLYDNESESCREPPGGAGRAAAPRTNPKPRL